MRANHVVFAPEADRTVPSTIRPRSLPHRTALTRCLSRCWAKRSPQARLITSAVCYDQPSKPRALCKQSKNARLLLLHQIDRPQVKSSVLWMPRCLFSSRSWFARTRTSTVRIRSSTIAFSRAQALRSVQRRGQDAPSHQECERGRDGQTTQCYAMQNPIRHRRCPNFGGADDARKG